MRLLGYVLLVVLIGQCFEWLMTGMELSNVMRLVVSITLIILFMGVVILAEKEELKKIPLLKQWF
jgi:ABC-type phosphate transport system permease subunit